jgi:hypothetical protein
MSNNKSNIQDYFTKIDDDLLEYHQDIRNDIKDVLFHKYFIDSSFEKAISRALNGINTEDVIYILNCLKGSSWDDSLLFKYHEYCGELNIPIYEKDEPLSVKLLINMISSLT